MTSTFAPNRLRTDKSRLRKLNIKLVAIISVTLPVSLGFVFSLLSGHRDVSSLQHSPSTHVCTSCCVEELASVLNLRVREPNIWCFELDSSRSNPTLLYTNLTAFDDAYSHYLSMAIEFISEIGARFTSRGKIVWRIEDDATLCANFLHWARSVHVAVFGHSVLKVSNVSHLYTCMVPNFHMIETRGFEQLAKQIATDGTSFLQRERRVFWAGSTTGTCMSNCSGCMQLDRVKLVSVSKQFDWLSFHISGLVQWCQGWEERLIASELLAKHQNERVWAQFRGILDVDGNVDAWGLRWRLESGSVVFMVESSYVNILSEALVEGVHYLRISPDLSDLGSVTSIVLQQDMDDVLHNISLNSKLLMKTHFAYSDIVNRIAHQLSKTFIGSGKTGG